MKTANIALLAGLSGSLLLSSTAEAVITGITVVPVSFEQGWLEADGSVFVDPSSPTADNDLHSRVSNAWAQANGNYKTFRIYVTVSDAATAVFGHSGNDVAQIAMIHESVRKDLSGPGNGFFNYSATAQFGDPGPQPRAAGSANGGAQGQRGFDSYLTVKGADQSTDTGANIEGVATMFDAVREISHLATAFATGQTGGLGAATSINCQNCGYLATTQNFGNAYSYNSAASLAANGGLPITGMGVLIAQLTVNALDGIQGQMRVVGTEFEQTFTYSANLDIPAPGALALLGVAGAVTRRRRRA
jgi:uncharacterized protein (TIGR03382 family)